MILPAGRISVCLGSRHDAQPCVRRADGGAEGQRLARGHIVAGHVDDRSGPCGVAGCWLHREYHDQPRRSDGRDERGKAAGFFVFSNRVAAGDYFSPRVERRLHARGARRWP